MSNISTRLEERIKEHAEIWQDMKKKAPLALMLWLFAGIFGFLIVMAGWGGHLWKSIGNNSICLAVMQKDIDHIVESVNKIEKRVNRIPIYKHLRDPKDPEENDD